MGRKNGVASDYLFYKDEFHRKLGVGIALVSSCYIAQEEGSSCPACGENYAATIAPHQKVYVLRREENTLIVASDGLFRP